LFELRLALCWLDYYVGWITILAGLALFWLVTSAELALTPYKTGQSLVEVFSLLL
jgi:hypothetical protein